MSRRGAFTLVLVLAVMLLALCPRAFTLDPSLDVNQYAHTAWKVRDGFFKAGINSIAQTPDGYIWLASQFGLLRFDGVRAIPWQPPANQHLPSSWIFSLLAARDGTLWIGTYNGLASWKDGKLTQYPELAGHYVFALLEDHESTIWASGFSSFLQGGRLCALHQANTQCYGDDGSLGRGAFNLYEDSKSNLWVGVLNGLWRWRPGPPKFYPLAGEPNGIRALGEDTDRALLVGWKGRIYRFIDGKTQAYPLPGVVLKFTAQGILRDREGGLWIGTANHGLVHVHQGRVDMFAQPDSLSSNFVDKLFEDREGNIWVGTNDGLDRFRDFAVATFSVGQGLSNALVTSVLADRNGSVWLGTLGGLNRWKTGQIEAFPIGTKLNDSPASLFQDDRGRLWVSTLRQFGYLENGSLIPISGIPGGNVLSIAQDRAANLWVINERLGLFRLSPRGEVQQIPWSKLGHEDHASVLAADPVHGGLWIGFFLGGIAYLNDGQIRASYTAADGLGEGRVGRIRFDPDGTVWAATEGGLSRLKNGHVATLTSRNGLPCDTVHWAIQDNDHSFWLYTACGLARIAHAELDAWLAAADENKDTKPTIHATVFDTSDGVRSLVSGSHYNPVVAKSSDGKLWFLPWDGVSVVDPRHLHFNKITPPVHIEQITADHKTYDASSQVNLPPLIHDLQIDYTALSLVAPEKVLFRYKLEGLDRDWQEAGNRRQAFYTNLPPANYRFRVIACNNSGVWNEAGTFLDFSVAPAYYQTLWFRSLCAFVFLALLAGIYRLRVRQLAGQFNLRLEERVNERTRIARDLHDTLLQSFQGLMLKFRVLAFLLPDRPAEAQKMLEEVIEQARAAITEGRDAVHGLRSSMVVTNDLAQSISALGEQLKAGHPSPDFSVHVEGETREIVPLLRDDVYRIAGEALRNAFQHARARHVEVEIRYDQRRFRLRVRDDGKGIDASVLAGDGKRGHYGLPGMHERAKLIGAKLEVWSELDSGTEVELTIPALRAYTESPAKRRFIFWRGTLVFATVLTGMSLEWCPAASGLDPPLDANQYSHTAWKIREGFAKGAIISIAQTPDGYLWLGTESGLFRFDGVRNVPWQPPEGKQLPSNYIYSLLAAHDGTLWIGTLKGLASWKDGKLAQYREVAGSPVDALLEDREQTVWFGVYEPSKGRLCAIRNGKAECYGAGTFGNFVGPRYQDHEGNLWAASQTELWRWGPGRPERYAFPRGVIEVDSLIEDDAGMLLLATNDGLKQLVAGKIEDYPLPGITGKFRPISFLRSQDGSLWITTSQGLLHRHQGRVDRFSAVDGLSGDAVDSIFQDREGNVWVATQDGLDRFREYAVPTISRNQGLSNLAAWAVEATPDSSIWIATTDGLNRWANGHVTIYRTRKAFSQRRRGDETELNASVAAIEIGNSGLVGTLRSLGLDDLGRLWASTAKGVFYFERGRFVRVPGLRGGNIDSIAGDGHGNVWILDATAGIFHWSPTTPIQHTPWTQFAQKTVRVMLPDQEPGGLWLGFFEGGLVYMKDGKPVRSYGPADGLGDGRINHLRWGSLNEVLASTESGLSRIKNGHVETLNNKNGLPCDEVHWSMEDDDHAVWVYMPCGLARIESSEWRAWVDNPRHIVKATIFDTPDGVRSVGVYGGYGPHVTKTPDGRIWFVPRDGVSVIDPRRLPFNKLPPPVHIEQIVADGRAYDPSRGLRLPPLVRNLSIDYTALSFVAPEKIHFRYKLEGQDPEWREVANDREVQYSNLAPRHYRFRVMACNNSGVWNEAGALLDFSVAPAYYQTLWFRSLCAFIFLALLAGLYRLRVRQLAGQFNLRLEERVNERTRIARDLHDTLLQSFQGLMLKFRVLALRLHDRPEEARMLEEVIEQARAAITEGRDAVHGLRSSIVVTNDLAQSISVLGEQLKADQAGHPSPDFSVHVEGETREIVPLLRDDVYRIAGEALRNAFQHAHARHVEVEIRYDQRRFRLRVRDDGKGIDARVLAGDGKSGHYGLPGMHERAKLIGAKLEVWSELDSGTEVELTIPASLAYTESPARRQFLFW